MGYRTVNDLIEIPKDQLIPNKSSSRGHHMKNHTIYMQEGTRAYYKYTFFPTYSVMFLLRFLLVYDRPLQKGVLETVMVTVGAITVCMFGGGGKWVVGLYFADF